MARGSFLWLFLSGEWLGALFAFGACRRQCSQLASQCSEVISCTDYGRHTAEVAATRILFLHNCTRPRPQRTTALSCIHNWYCNDARLPRRPELQPRRRSKKQYSFAPLTSVVIAPVDESDRKIETTQPTRLHHLSGQHQRDSGRAAMAVSVIFVSHNGCVSSFCEP